MELQFGRTMMPTFNKVPKFLSFGNQKITQVSLKYGRCCSRDFFTPLNARKLEQLVALLRISHNDVPSTAQSLPISQVWTVLENLATEFESFEPAETRSWRSSFHSCEPSYCMYLRLAKYLFVNKVKRQRLKRVSCPEFPSPSWDCIREPCKAARNRGCSVFFAVWPASLSLVSPCLYFSLT